MNLKKLRLSTYSEVYCGCKRNGLRKMGLFYQLVSDRHGA